MNQNIWGRHLWFFLHTLTFNYPLNPTKENKEQMMQLLNSLKNLIPCSVCRKHYVQNITEHEPQLDNREKFFKWMVNLHNIVNGYTGRRNWSYDEVLKYYEHEYMTKFDLTKGDDNQIENIVHNKLFLSNNFFISLILLITIFITYVYSNNITKIFKSIFNFT